MYIIIVTFLNIIKRFYDEYGIIFEKKTHYYILSIKYVNSVSGFIAEHIGEKNNVELKLEKCTYLKFFRINHLFKHLNISNYYTF